MREALREAARAVGKVAPNPAVGCVIVKAGRVIARGYTHPPGQQHAEVDALAKAGAKARGATAFVTLEPCNHVGRTGKCSEALIAAGVKRVVVGMRDPNPQVDGGGVERLKQAGVKVTVGVLEAECRAVNEGWEHVVTTGRPLVTLKAAVTLDGRIAARSGDSKWITGEEARAEAHRLRAEHDAILVGARTVALDDPELTVRHVKGRSPLRVIVDGKLSIPADAKALPAILVATEGAPDRPDLVARGCTILHLPAGPRPDSGRVDLEELLRRLARMNIQSVLVEGGGEIHGQLLAARLADRATFFVAPKLIGSGGAPVVAQDGPDQMANAWKLQGISWKRLGDDILVRGSFVW
jgi:diaminohydroxyphosphoribosylaminopyrimidine deaminase/5-amino-6-(5-phosphoribosylamino)uracil reductase